MALKNGIFSLALGALLMGSTAMAQEAQNHDASAQLQAPPPGAETNTQAFRHGGGNGDRGGNGERRWDRDRDDRERRGARPGRIEVHVHSANCHHSPQPAPPQYQQGRYELRYDHQWVPGYYQQVWVPEDCRYKPRRGGMKCKGGYYDQQWVPGRYQTVEKWVWVPGHHRRPQGPEWGNAGGRW